MTMMHGSQQALWMHNFLKEIDFRQTFPANLLVDNNLSIALAQSTKRHAQVKHINICHHYISKRIAEGDIKVAHILSSKNIADICTKPLTRATHDYLVELIELKSSDSCTSQGEC